MIRHTFHGHEQDIYSLDFARNGRHIASGSGDRTVRVWDIESGQNVLTLSIEDGVTTVAISPDGKLVAAGSLDKSVRVWDAHTGYLMERLEGADGHRDSVYSVAFSPSGRDLVSGSLDKTIKMWELHAPSGRTTHGQGTTRGKCVKTFEGHKVRRNGFHLSCMNQPANRVTGLRAQCRTDPRWKVGPEWLQRSRRAVLGSPDRECATYASRAQELWYVTASPPPLCPRMPCHAHHRFRHISSPRNLFTSFVDQRVPSIC